MLDWLVKLSRRPFHEEMPRNIRVVSPFCTAELVFQHANIREECVALPCTFE